MKGKRGKRRRRKAIQEDQIPMPEIIKVLMELVKSNPALLADLFEIIKRVLALLETYPDLAAAVASALKGQGKDAIG